MIRQWGLVSVVFLAALAGPGLASAQTVVHFKAPEVGDRRVVLTWDPVPGDTLDSYARIHCLDDCAEYADSDSVAERRCIEECERPLFGGYQIWRSSAGDTAAMVLLRTYSVFDTVGGVEGWTFRGRERIFVDPDSVIVRACKDVQPNVECVKSKEKAIAPFNGFPYYYAITWYESRPVIIAGTQRIVEQPMQTEAQGKLGSPVQPSAMAVTTKPLLGHVLAVPNPYNPRDPARRQSFGTENRIEFINLPSPATVRIYTSSGDLVRTLVNNDTDDTVDWDLKNGAGDDVVGGIYMFYVETPLGGQARSGHFVIIR